jgi:hypothetical protein
VSWFLVWGKGEKILAGGGVPSRPARFPEIWMRLLASHSPNAQSPQKKARKAAIQVCGEQKELTVAGFLGPGEGHVPWNCTLTLHKVGTWPQSNDAPAVLPTAKNIADRPAFPELSDKNSHPKVFKNYPILQTFPMEPAGVLLHWRGCTDRLGWAATHFRASVGQVWYHSTLAHAFDWLDALPVIELGKCRAVVI